jgi:hypothetical protein
MGSASLAADLTYVSPADVAMIAGPICTVSKNKYLAQTHCNAVVKIITRLQRTGYDAAQAGFRGSSRKVIGGQTNRYWCGQRGHGAASGYRRHKSNILRWVRSMAHCASVSR